MRIQIDVQVWRGAIRESRHRVHAVVCDAAGRRFASTEDAELVTSFRSSAKPFQLLPLVERGHAERFGFRDEELAVMAGSHTGSAYHLGLVRGILSRLGLTESKLACGYHDPVDADSLAHVQKHPADRTGLYNNCSGKHAGMLALAVAEGWPLAGYERDDHPLQRLMAATVAECCDVPVASLQLGVDGCSVCVFGLPLAAMARGYARLAAARGAGEARERALARIRGAMQAFPVATSGVGRFSTVLMESAPAVLVAKAGAEGLECVGLVERGLGVALKCEDGAMRALAPATVALLDQLGSLDGAALEKLAAQRRPLVTNAAGIAAGHLEAEIRVLAPASA